MPVWLAKLQALLTSPLPNGLRPLTYDQVLLLQKPSVVSEAAKAEHRTLMDLGISSPHGVAAIVPTYLERFGPAASSRTTALRAEARPQTKRLRRSRSQYS